MGNWKNTLLPLTALLAVLALAVTPGRLSRLRDADLSGTVHPEVLGENRNFPIRPPALPERIRMLARWGSGDVELAAIRQTLEGAALEDLLLQARQAIETLEAAGVLPAGSMPPYTVLGGQRVYLRDPADLSGAGFLLLETFDEKTRQQLSLYLDRETGRILALELVSDSLREMTAETVFIGCAFLESLELECGLIAGADSEALFRLADGETLYEVRHFQDGIDILPQWGGESSGVRTQIQALPPANDAEMTQK